MEQDSKFSQSFQQNHTSQSQCCYQGNPISGRLTATRLLQKKQKPTVHKAMKSAESNSAENVLCPQWWGEYTSVFWISDSTRTRYFGQGYRFPKLPDNYSHVVDYSQGRRFNMRQEKVHISKLVALQPVWMTSISVLIVQDLPLFQSSAYDIEFQDIGTGLLSSSLQFCCCQENITTYTHTQFRQSKLTLDQKNTRTYSQLIRASYVSRESCETMMLTCLCLWDIRTCVSFKKVYKILNFQPSLFSLFRTVLLCYSLQIYMRKKSSETLSRYAVLPFVIVQKVDNLSFPTTLLTHSTFQLPNPTVLQLCSGYLPTTQRGHTSYGKYIILVFVIVMKT